MTGEPVAYGKRLIARDGFAAAVRDFVREGGRGCNITVPFKFEAAPLATRLTPRGYVRTTYSAHEIDGVAAYCAGNGQCYWLPIEEFEDQSLVYSAAPKR